MIHFPLLLNLFIVLQTSALKLDTAFPITSSSPFDKGSKPEKIEIKGYLFQTSKRSDPSYAFKEVLQRLEKDAKDLCANSVMELKLQSFRQN